MLVPLPVGALSPQTEELQFHLALHVVLEFIVLLMLVGNFSLRVVL